MRHRELRKKVHAKAISKNDSLIATFFEADIAAGLNVLSAIEIPKIAIQR